MTSRRAFLLGAATALAAPAIVPASSLMKLWVPPAPALVTYPEVVELTLRELLAVFHASKLEAVREWRQILDSAAMWSYPRGHRELAQ